MNQKQQKIVVTVLAIVMILSLVAPMVANILGLFVG